MSKVNSKTEDTKLIFNKLDQHFGKYQNLYFYLSMGLLTLFSILLFDVRISEGGDDSGYLLSAKKFIEGTSFPSFHGAFYSILIGLIIKLFGFKLMLFKLLSLLFLLGSQTFLYYGLKNRISPFILVSTLLISSVCSGLIYFGSQTYTEAFFLFLQGGFIFVFFKYLFNTPNNFSHIKQSWPSYLAVGAIALMMYTTRNVGIVSFLTLVAYFLLDKKFIPALYVFVSYQLFSFPYGLYKKLAWGITQTDMSGQLQLVLQKDPYNKALGTENVAGIFTRVIENLKNYLSKIFMQQIGLKDFADNNTNLFIAILIVAILLGGLVLAFTSKNKVLKFILLYIGMSLGATFIALHQMWSQARMVIVYIPLLLIALAWTFALISRFKKLAFFKYIPIVFFIIIFFKSFLFTAHKASDHQKILTKNLSGNKYYGYTPDWINFLKMSEWAAKKVDGEYKIGSRKPSMSFIYGKGREFYPLYRLPIQHVDSVMATVLASEKQAYFILEDELRKKPAVLFYTLKPDMLAGLRIDTKFYGVYLVDKNKTKNLEAFFDQNGLSVINSAEKFQVDIISKGQRTTALLCQMILLNQLRDNNVRYLIMANLRVNPKMKTDRTINTVERYIASMQLKYPEIVRQVHQIGSNENEPARLYIVDFEKYGK